MKCIGLRGVAIVLCGLGSLLCPSRLQSKELLFGSATRINVLRELDCRSASNKVVAVGSLGDKGAAATIDGGGEGNQGYQTASVVLTYTLPGLRTVSSLAVNYAADVDVPARILVEGSADSGVTWKTLLHFTPPVCTVIATNFAPAKVNALRVTQHPNPPEFYNRLVELHVYADAAVPPPPLYGLKDARGAFDYMRDLYHEGKATAIASPNNAVWDGMGGGTVGQLFNVNMWQVDGVIDFAGEGAPAGQRVYLRFDLDQAYQMDAAIFGSSGEGLSQWGGRGKAEFYTSTGVLDPSGLVASDTAALTGQGWILQGAWTNDGAVCKRLPLPTPGRYRQMLLVWDAIFLNRLSNFELFGCETSPPISNAAPADVTATSATLHGVLASNRMSASSVSVQWGANDGATVFGDWQCRRVVRGSPSDLVFSEAVTELLPNQSYYYTFSSSAGDRVEWASPSRTFKTWGPPAAANGVGSAGEDNATVTLRGTLLNGQAASAAIHWGTNAASLTNMSLAGMVAEGPFSVVLQGLQPEDTCYYRCQVSNAYGVAWAPSVTNFSALLSRMLRLERNAEFGDALTVGTACLERVRNPETLKACHEAMARLRRERRVAAGLASAVAALETHPEIAESELLKEADVGVLLLRQAVRERDGTVLVNAAAVLTALDDPETPALLVSRLRTCKEPATVAMLLSDLSQLRKQIPRSLAADVVEVIQQLDAGRTSEAQAILEAVAELQRGSPGQLGDSPTR